MLIDTGPQSAHRFLQEFGEHQSISCIDAVEPPACLRLEFQHGIAAVLRKLPPHGGDLFELGERNLRCDENPGAADQRKCELLGVRKIEIDSSNRDREVTGQSDVLPGP